MFNKTIKLMLFSVKRHILFLKNSKKNCFLLFSHIGIQSTQGGFFKTCNINKIKKFLLHLCTTDNKCERVPSKYPNQNWPVDLKWNQI